MSNNPKLLPATDYIKDAVETLKNVKSRAFLLSMVVAEDDSTNQLIEALKTAARRGVEVNIAADIYTYMELSGTFVPSHYYSKKVRATSRMTKSLSKSGAHFHWLGQSSMTLFTGRTHSKWCVIDDTVYVFGGVNMHDRGIENTDYMFKFKDHKLADILINEQKQILRSDKEHFGLKSHKVAYNDDIIYFDGGFMGDSIIYRRACQLTKNANDVLLVSQYCPTGKLSRLLKKTNSRLYFNHWRQASGVNRPLIMGGMTISKQKTLYTRDNYLHAKFIIFTMADGRKIAISGSHNFASSGVLAGTREIALETANPKIISQLEQFYQKYVK